MSYASEAETGALYYGFKRAIPCIVTLQEMGHLQSEPTPVTTDKNTSHGLTIGTMTSKHEVPVVEVPQIAEVVCIPMGTWAQESF